MSNTEEIKFLNKVSKMDFFRRFFLFFKILGRSFRRNRCQEKDPSKKARPTES